MPTIARPTAEPSEGLTAWAGAPFDAAPDFSLGEIVGHLDGQDIVLQRLEVTEGEETDEVDVVALGSVTLHAAPAAWAVAGGQVSGDDPEAGSTGAEGNEYRLVIAYTTAVEEVWLEYFVLRSDSLDGLRRHRKTVSHRAALSEVPYYHNLVMDYHAGYAYVAITKRDVTSEQYSQGLAPGVAEIVTWSVYVGPVFSTLGAPSVVGGSGRWHSLSVDAQAEVASVLAVSGRDPLVVYNLWGNDAPVHREQPAEWVDGEVGMYLRGRGYQVVDIPGAAGVGVRLDEDHFLLPVQHRDEDRTGHVQLYEITYDGGFPQVALIGLEVLTVHGNANWRPAGMRVAQVEVPAPVSMLDIIYGLGFDMDLLDLLVYLQRVQVEASATTYLLVTASVPDQPADAVEPTSMPSYGQLVDLAADIEGGGTQPAVVGPVLYVGHGDIRSVVALGHRMVSIRLQRRGGAELYADVDNELVPVPREELGMLLRLPEPLTDEDVVLGEDPTALAGPVEVVFL